MKEGHRPTIDAHEAQCSDVDSCGDERLDIALSGVEADDDIDRSENHPGGEDREGA